MKKNRFILYLVLILSIKTLSSEKVDTLQIKFSPYLGSKYKFGVELNPGLILYASDQKATVISTGISIFPKNRKTELTIPIIYEYSKDDDWFNGNYFGKSINIEFHYRYYLIGKLGGIYNGVGLKYNYAYLEPEIDEEEYEFAKKEIVSRLGLGFGIGYRIFSNERIYWGIGIFIGRYFLGRDISDKISLDSMFSRDENAFVTIQLLKVGYAF
ncbi:MAG: hypothetical protein M0R34_06995 [Candidatus Marinimicrobia bacterium]|jgi:hypothetical protein|nr:hypothetical protein [Candidatus Neomarinimicrobiota bacterium]